MKKLLVFLFAAFIGLSLDVRFGDLRYSVDGYTVRHWEVVPQATFFKPACALVRSGGYPCPGSGGATSYTLTGPSSGTIGIVSSNYTVTGNGTTNALVTPSDASHGGIFAPTTVNLNNNAPVTFTYDPLQIGAYNISTTNGGGLSNPPAISFSTAANLLAGYPGFTASYLTNDVTLTTGGVSDPFGGANTATITEDNLAAFHYAFQNLTDTANTVRTLSAFVKAGSGTRNFQISLCDNTYNSCFQSIFNPTSCAFVQSNPQGSSVVNSNTELLLSNGWCLVTVTGAVNGGFTSVIYAVQLMNGTTGNYTGDGSSSLKVYGGAIE